MAQIKINSEEFSKRKLFVATPMYGGMCNGNYVLSLLNLSNETKKCSISTSYDFLFNESLVQRGRNMLCSMFLDSDATHMIFIDADIGFQAEYVLTLLALCGNTENINGNSYDIIGGTYPKKTISWDKIALAVEKGVPNEKLADHMGNFVLNFPDGTNKFKYDEPVEVLELGTGFMMFTREVLEKYMEAFPNEHYTPDNIGMSGFGGEKQIHCFFDCAIDPETNRYLSEDYYFCRRARDIGFKVWMCPWMNIDHYGTFKFTGNLGAFVGMSA